MADVKPLILADGLPKEMGPGENLPVANMPTGGVLPLTSSYEFPVNCEIILVDRTTGIRYRLFMNNGILDQEIVT